MPKRPIFSRIATNAGTRTFITDADGLELEIWGYRFSMVRTTLTWVGYIITAFTLRLFFHWLPHWQLTATHRRCPLASADIVLIKDQYNQYSVHPVSIVTPDGTTVKITQPLNLNFSLRDFGLTSSAATHLLRPNRPSLFPQTISDVSLIAFFYFKKLKYIWDADYGGFIMLRGWEEGPCSRFHTVKPLDVPTAARRRVLYGENNIVVPITPVVRMLLREGLNPFYIFQAASCTIWFWDNYWMYASCIVIISTMSLTWQLVEMRRNERTLRDTVCSSGCARVCRTSGPELTFVEMNAAELVPGDVIEIPQNGCIMHCDAVLISGNCIVNESMLTGESVPVTKTPLPNPRYRSNQMQQNNPGPVGSVPVGEQFNIKAHARHILFCGTQVIQTRYYEGEFVRAVVVRTGFRTAKGDMVRSIMFPKPVGFKFNQDTIKFVGVLGVFAAIGFTYSCIIMVHGGASIGKVLRRALDTITIVVPPALPVAMTVGIVFAHRRLKRKNIFCISPNTINVCGVVDAVCFDKTGTLTEDGLDLWGVVPCDEGRFLDPIDDPSGLSHGPLLETMATCHSLTRIQGELSGDPLDLKMFHAIKWELIEEMTEDHRKFEMAVPTIVRPSEPDIVPRTIPIDSMTTELPYEIGIIRQFTFSSSLQRMSVVARVLNSPNFSLYVKGSPEMIETLCRRDTLPRDFQSVLLYYTREGYRVLALAWRPLKSTYTKVLRVQREKVECELRFLGLLVMENRLKPETTQVIHTLKAANIRPVMVTGDNMLTALSVARDCGMIDEQDRVILVSANLPIQGREATRDRDRASRSSQEDFGDAEQLVQFHYAEDLQRPVTEVTATSGSPQRKSWHKRGGTNAAASLSIRMIDRPDFHLAMSGKTWATIRESCPQLIPKLVVKGTVFARFSPDQKGQLVEQLQSVGYYVGMCGDGANDCGALKTAHSGISLSEAEASVASPFTSKTPNISCVPELIKEGRCALTTSFGTFKYMAGYSLTQFFSVLTLYWFGANLTDGQFLYIDLLLITTLGISFGYTRAFQHLSVDPPSVRLVSAVIIMSLILQMVLNFSFQIAALLFIKSQPWFVPFHSSEDEEEYNCFESTTIFICSSFQYIILAVVFAKGAPYRKSIFTNYFFIMNVIGALIMTVAICLTSKNLVTVDFLKLVDYPSISPRLLLLGGAVGNFFIAYMLETLIDGVAFRRRMRRIRRILFPRHFHRKDYERIREEIDRSAPAWPPVTRSASVQDIRRDVFCEAPYPTTVSATNTPSRKGSKSVAANPEEEALLNDYMRMHRSSSEDPMSSNTAGDRHLGGRLGSALEESCSEESDSGAPDPFSPLCPAPAAEGSTTHLPALTAGNEHATQEPSSNSLHRQTTLF